MIRGYRWRQLVGSWLVVLFGVALAVGSYVLKEGILRSHIPADIQTAVFGVCFVIGCVGAALLVPIAVYITVSFLVSPHPAHHYLEAYGPPAELLKDLEKELAQTEGVLTIELGDADPPRWLSHWHPGSVHHNVLITPSWVVQFVCFNDIPAVRLDDVLWARKLPGRLRRESAVEVGGRRAGAVTFTLDDKSADDFLQEIVRRLPWVLNGLDERWQRGGEPDWAGIIAEVERRRQEHMARAAAPKEAPKPT
jgi:hypothetical protein